MKKQRFIITFLIIAILFLFNINVYAEDILYGDTDGNGRVSISDAMLIDQYLNDILDLDYAAQKRSDVDQDNIISTNDKRIIQSYLSGVLTTLPVIMGDVNDDGVVDNTDFEMIFLYSDNGTSLTEKQQIIADVNLDDSVDLVDATYIQRLIAGRRQTLPVVEGKEIIEPEPDPTTQPTTPPETNDEQDDVVKVEDTLSKKTIIMTIIGISLLLVGGIISLITIIEKRKKDKKVD